MATIDCGHVRVIIRRLYRSSYQNGTLIQDNTDPYTCIVSINKLKVRDETFGTPVALKIKMNIEPSHNDVTLLTVDAM